MAFKVGPSTIWPDNTIIILIVQPYQTQSELIDRVRNFKIVGYVRNVNLL